MKSLITGITGFAGSHLADYLLHTGRYEVQGLLRWRSNLDNLESSRDDIHFVEADIRDHSSVFAAISRLKPDYIFHLAAQSFVPSSWNAPAESINTNVMGTLNLFEAVRAADINPVILVACSSEEYGNVSAQNLPVRESCPLKPLSPYAVSKVGQDMLSYQYFSSWGLNIIRTRAFNHTGPRRPDVFVCSSFARQVAEIEKGLQEPVIHTGNLDAIRDFTDVRDMVRAYEMAVHACESGQVYNICSGQGISISRVLDILLTSNSVQAARVVDEPRLRPSDVPVLIGDSTLFTDKTGWNRTISFEQTMEDLLNYWRERTG